MTLNYEGAWEGFGGQAEGSIAHLSYGFFVSPCSCSCLVVSISPGFRRHGGGVILGFIKKAWLTPTLWFTLILLLVSSCSLLVIFDTLDGLLKSRTNEEHRQCLRSTVKSFNFLHIHVPCTF